MVEKKEVNIKNESSLFINYDLSKKITTSGIENCVVEIKQEKKGIGFFCFLPSQNYKFFFTNNYVLDQNFLDKEKKIIFKNHKKEEKEINLEINRYKFTNEEFGFTVIEILEEDNITNFLEVDQLINSEDYNEKEIFCLYYQKEKDFSISPGTLLRKDKNKRFFIYSLDIDDEDYSGSPILLIENLKLIGMHKGKYDCKMNYGICFNIIINKINFIKCVFNIDKQNIGKEIKIINKSSNNYNNRIKIIIDKKIEPIRYRYTFNKEGKKNVYFLQEDSLSNISCMFYECIFLEKINLSFFNTENVTNMSKIFANCTLLKDINLYSFNTKKVTNMSYMFFQCTSLKKINLSSFKTNNVTNMSFMFYSCTSLKKIDLSSFETDIVNDMSSMFSHCSLLKKIDLSSFNTHNVINMAYMFFECNSLKELNLYNFKSTKLKDMSDMFTYHPLSCQLICTDKEISKQFNKSECLIF